MKNKKNQYVFWQVLFWIAFLGFQIFSDYKLFDFKKNILNNSSYTAFVCGLVYINVHYLIPKFFLKKKYGFYFLIVIIILLLVSYGYFLLENTIINDSVFEEFVSTNEFAVQIDLIYPFVEFMVTVGAISSIFIAFQQNQVREQLIQIEKQNISSQLEVLKSQTNPHFLFNVLNTIHFLIYKNQEQASETLLKLSDLLRYQLYETSPELVSLQKELEQINNYIDLELMRTSKKLKFISNLNEQHANVKLPPFLLLPLIENAFKHSNNTSERYICFYIKVSENQLFFETKNSIGKETSQKPGGIGLTNLKQRLELLYPQKHSFSIEKNDKEFTTYLKIDL